MKIALALVSGFAVISLGSLTASAQAPGAAGGTSVPAATNVPNIPPGTAAKLDAAKAAGDKAQAQALVNLNTASQEDLQKLPGIGPAKAKAIIDARPYKSVEDLKKVKGIKEAVLAKIRPLVTVK